MDFLKSVTHQHHPALGLLLAVPPPSSYYKLFVSLRIQLWIRRTSVTPQCTATELCWTTDIDHYSSCFSQLIFPMVFNMKDSKPHIAVWIVWNGVSAFEGKASYVFDLMSVFLLFQFDLTSCHGLLFSFMMVLMITGLLLLFTVPFGYVSNYSTHTPYWVCHVDDDVAILCNLTYIFLYYYCLFSHP